MPHTIVIADDDVHALLLLQINLAKAGFNVVTARNGQEALELTQQHKPDLVILDVMMPIMDGWDALAGIRNGQETAETIVILLTALASDADMTRGLYRGADLYISKPYDPPEVVLMVQRLLQSAESESTSS